MSQLSENTLPQGMTGDEQVINKSCLCYSRYRLPYVHSLFLFLSSYCMKFSLHNTYEYLDKFASLPLNSRDN